MTVPSDILKAAQSITSRISERMESSSTLGDAATEIIAEALQSATIVERLRNPLCYENGEIDDELAAAAMAVSADRIESLEAHLVVLRRANESLADDNKNLGIRATEIAFELDEARSTNKRLHRRVQVAERFQEAVGGQAKGLWEFYQSYRPESGTTMWASTMYRAVVHRLEVSKAEVAAIRSGEQPS